MERTNLLLFLCAAVGGDVGKHIFVPESMKWLDAQMYCRKYYIDLSFVSSQSDQDRLLLAAGAHSPVGWIGLHRDTSDITAWKWSGGGHVAYQNWADGQPDNVDNSEVVGHLLSNGKWNDDDEEQLNPFYCINIVVEEVQKSWEEALEHCRDNDKKLTSLLSETQLLLARKVFQKVNITERVWIGLRYLEDGWLWENGDPLVYDAWPQGGDQDHQCPVQKRCGALTKEGLWENWDCWDQLNFICQ